MDSHGRILCSLELNSMDHLFLSVFNLSAKLRPKCTCVQSSNRLKITHHQIVSNWLFFTLAFYLNVHKRDCWVTFDSNNLQFLHYFPYICLKLKFIYTFLLFMLKFFPLWLINLHIFMIYWLSSTDHRSPDLELCTPVVNGCLGNGGSGSGSIESLVDDETCDNSIDGEAACGKSGGFINFFLEFFRPPYPPPSRTVGVIGFGF